MRKKQKGSPKKDAENAVKRSFAERMGTVLDLPVDLLCGGCYLELRGRNDLRIQGCRKILVYTEEEIVLRLRHGGIRVRGRRLVCSSYHAGHVMIDGWISGMEFVDAEGLI